MKTKKARRIYTLEEIKFEKSNKLIAVLSCIPIISIGILLFERENIYIKYISLQTSILTLFLILNLIPFINNTIAPIVNFVVSILVLFSILKVTEEKRFDIPNISGLALKLINSY